MRKNNVSKIKMTYEPQADVLRIEARKTPIDYASEVGNVVVHFDRNGVPVYFEILEASKFMRQAATLFPLTFQREALSAR